MAPASLGLLIDSDKPEPLYRQIFDALVARIRDGALPAGHRLPPTRALAEELGAHRNTVVRAYEALENAGFVSSTVGRGTFVIATERPRPTGEASPVTSSLSWSSLTSRALDAEPLQRLARLPRPPATVPMIDLSRMQPPAELMPDALLARCLRHVLREKGARILGYAPREGVPALREQIARDLVRRGVPATADDIIVTSGSQQALDLVVRALVDPGERLLLQEQTYAGALRLFASLGARLSVVASDDEGPTVESLEATQSGARLLYLMPDHHNPTGREISVPRRRALVAWSHAASVPLVEDDYAADLSFDDTPPPTPLRALSGDVLHIGTYSKKLIPALRIGYLVCPAGLRPHLMTLKHAMDLGSSGLVQHALAEFLDRGYLEAHLGRARVLYAQRRDALEGALRAHLPAAVTWTPARRGITHWLELPEGTDVVRVYEAAAERGVLVIPGEMHRVDGRPSRGVRLVFGYEPPDRLREGVKRLGEAIAEVLADGDAPATPSPSVI
jgi:GntR family transcriptional regulator/MocR family aminotransferase